MTRYVPQWLQAGTYAASLDRRLIGAIWPAPASSGCAVTAAGTGMDLHVDPGQVAVPSPNGTGSVLCTSDAIETVTLAPAPPAGTDRVDLIVCQPRSADLDGVSTQEDFIFAVAPGPEGAPPGAPPAVPAGTVALAQVHVTGGAASLTPADITDRRPTGLAIPSPADIWKLPRGFEGRYVHNNNSGSFVNNVQADMAGLTVTFTPEAGRSYLVTLLASFTINSVGNLQVFITNAANAVLAASFANMSVNAGGWQMHARCLVGKGGIATPPAGVPYTVKARAQGSSPDMRWIGGASANSSFGVEDVGAW